MGVFEMNLLKRIWVGKTKVKEPKVNEPKVKEPEEVTRREMVDRLFGVNIHWGSKLNEEVERAINLHINMVKTEWSIYSDLIPSICLEQSLRDDPFRLIPTKINGDLHY
jgi:hypothetical protein